MNISNNFIDYFILFSLHTEFSPDRHFGTIKKRFRQLGCRSTTDMIGEEGIIKRSAVDNDYILYSDPFDQNKKSFEWLDWERFLSAKYGPCKGISKWHVVIVDSEFGVLRFLKALVVI